MILSIRSRARESDGVWGVVSDTIWGVGAKKGSLYQGKKKKGKKKKR